MEGALRGEEEREGEGEDEGEGEGEGACRISRWNCFAKFISRGVTALLTVLRLCEVCFTHSRVLLL